jgi:hypothetical protein
MAWPLPAFVAWAFGWSAFVGLRALAVSPALALALAALLTGLLATTGTTPWRCVFMGAGFPLSLAASGSGGGLPAWAWLAALAALALVYPVSAWRDAPIFPTPRGALAGLGRTLALPEHAAVLDAGSGLGDALVELRREFPLATALRLALPVRQRSPRRYVGRRLVGVRSRLSVPAAGEHAASRRQGSARTAPGRLAGEPGVRGRLASLDTGVSLCRRPPALALPRPVRASRYLARLRPGALPPTGRSRQRRDLRIVVARQGVDERYSMILVR